MQTPKTVEQIKTTKSNCTFSVEIRDDGTARIRLSDCTGEKYDHMDIAMVLDDVDLRRIHLLLEDHILYDGEHGPL